MRTHTGGEGSAITSLASLPSTPAFDRFVLENPWPLAAGLALVGGVLLFVLGQRSETRKALICGALGVVLAVATALAGWLVTTDREAARAQTARFVRAAVESDVATAGPMLSDALLVLTGGQTGRNAGGQGKDWLLRVIDEFERFGVRWHRLSDLQAAGSGGVVTVRFTVTVQTDMPGAPLTSTEWEAAWTRDGPSNWTMRTLNCRRLNGQPADPGWIRYAPWAMGGG